MTIFSQLITLEKCQEFISRQCAASNEFIWIMILTSFLLLAYNQLAGMNDFQIAETFSSWKIANNMFWAAVLINVIYLVWFAFLR